MKKYHLAPFLFMIILIATACQTSTLPEESNATPHTNQPVSTTTKPSQDPTHEQSLPLKIYQAAKIGKLMFVENISIGTSVQDVLAKLGTPESGDPSILSYEKRCHCGFISKDTQRISAIQSSHPQVQQLTIQQVKKDLGQPEQSGTSFGDNYLLYDADPYRLSFYYKGDQVLRIYLEK